VVVVLVIIFIVIILPSIARMPNPCRFVSVSLRRWRRCGRGSRPNIPLTGHVDKTMTGHRQITGRIDNTPTRPFRVRFMQALAALRKEFQASQKKVSSALDTRSRSVEEIRRAMDEQVGPSANRARFLYAAPSRLE
jgi:hypothetical protein